MNTEMMKLEQLIQATSGLKNRNATPIIAEGKPISEVRISVKDDVPCVNLVMENPVMKRRDARCAFDESIDCLVSQMMNLLPILTTRTVWKSMAILWSSRARNMANWSA